MDKKTSSEFYEQRIQKLKEDLKKSRVKQIHYRNILKSSPVPIIVYDLANNVDFVNKSFTEVFGWRSWEIKGKKLDFVPEENQTETITAVKRMLIGNSAEILESRRFTRDGKILDIELSARSVESPHEDRIGSFVIIRDVTERRKRAKELEFLNLSLEKAVEQAQMMTQKAEEATKAKSSFLASMSHEIRTPMNAIIGMTNLLMDTPLNNEQQDFINVVYDSCDALLTIINDILDFSKIEAGSLELEYQPFDFRKCVYSALSMISNNATKKGIELCAMIEADTPLAVKGDVTRLRQILVNLLNNAVKFTDKGEIVLSVVPKNHTREPDGGEWYELEIAIKDTGIGIDEAGQKRLFKSFSQVDASTTRKYGGTGLGLAICKQLVKLMDGDIWVESTPGEGTTFIFTIKVKEAELETPVYMTKDQPQLREKSVLGVDDNKTNRTILKRQLETWGMKPVIVSSGREALDLLNKGSVFDFAILDMQMPEMDGVMLAKEIRKRHDTKNLPLIVLSSMGSRDSTISKDLFNAFHTKPIEPSQLYNSFLQVLGNEINLSHTESSFYFDSETAQRHPLRILLTEDNVINQKVALALLSRMGYRADVAANGFEALKAIEHQVYDVILMDVQMPEMDGLEATRKIRLEIEKTKQPKIIAMTANAMMEDKKECFEAGMDEYVSKPIQVQNLYDALMSCSPDLSTVIVSDVNNKPSLPEPEGKNHKTDFPETVIDLLAFDRLKKTLGKQADAILPGLIDDFAENSEKLIAQAHLALAENNAKDLRRAVHSLKSNGANLGAMAFSRSAEELENLAKVENLDNAKDLLGQIKEEFLSAENALKHLKEELEDGR